MKGVHRRSKGKKEKETKSVKIVFVPVSYISLSWFIIATCTYTRIFIPSYTPTDFMQIHLLSSTPLSCDKLHQNDFPIALFSKSLHLLFSFHEHFLFCSQDILWDSCTLNDFIGIHGLTSRSVLLLNENVELVLSRVCSFLSFFSSLHDFFLFFTWRPEQSCRSLSRSHSERETIIGDSVKQE